VDNCGPVLGERPFHADHGQQTAPTGKPKNKKGGQAVQRDDLSFINNTVLTLMDHPKVRNVAAQQHVFAAQPHKELALLLGLDF